MFRINGDEVGRRIKTPPKPQSLILVKAIFVKAILSWRGTGLKMRKGAIRPLQAQELTHPLGLKNRLFINKILLAYKNYRRNLVSPIKLTQPVQPTKLVGTLKPLFRG